MGLAASQARLLTLTARKADIELDLTIFASRKMSLTREMQQLSSEYYSRLNNKQISFYANNKYNKINYNYLMGGGNYTQVLNNAATIKSNNRMLLTDYKGNVVLSSEYAKILANVMGLSSAKSGGVCSPSDDQYAAMLEQVTNGGATASEFRTVLNSGYVPAKLATTSGGSVDDEGNKTNSIKRLIDFYLPIFKAAATNGWTTEYEQYWDENEDYISDSLVSGTLQLAIVGDDGHYTTEDSLNYFVTAGYIQTNSSSDTREAITAWYESEKLILTNKETYWDTEISNSSTELEAIKTEIDSVKSLIEDAMKKFEWNT